MGEGRNRKWWVLAAVGTGTFMSALDGSIVNVILPIVRSSLKADVATVEWVVTVYLLVVSGVLLSFGRLGDLRGQRRVYLTGFVVFVAASALCGFAQTPQWLVATRGIQAIGAAMLFANSPAILTKTFPPEQRGQALGLQATMTYLGLTVGPSLGGLLAQHVSWRAVFYVNIPVGALACALSYRFVPRDEPSKKAAPFDFVGAAIFFAGLFGLLLALNQGHHWGWGSPATLILGGASLAALVGFVLFERRARSPMLDLSLFRNATFSAATASAILNYVALFSVVFLLPFYLIQARQLSPSQTGLLLTAQPLVMSIAAPFSGTLSDRIGTRPLAIAGMSILALGLFFLSRLEVDTPLWHVPAALAVCGLGTGTFIAPNNSSLMGSAPRERQGIAAGILATSRNVGMVMGVGISGAIFTTVLRYQGPGPSAVAAAAAMGILGACLVALAGAGTSSVQKSRRKARPVS